MYRCTHSNECSFTTASQPSLVDKSPAPQFCLSSNSIMPKSAYLGRGVGQRCSFLCTSAEREMASPETAERWGNSDALNRTNSSFISEQTENQKDDGVIVKGTFRYVSLVKLFLLVLTYMSSCQLASCSLKLGLSALWHSPLLCPIVGSLEWKSGFFPSLLWSPLLLAALFFLGLLPLNLHLPLRGGTGCPSGYSHTCICPLLHSFTILLALWLYEICR